MISPQQTFVIIHISINSELGSLNASVNLPPAARAQHGLLASRLLANKLSQEAIHAIQAHDFRSGVKPNKLISEALIFADSLAHFLESKAEFEENNPVFKGKPWLWSKLTEFQDKYDFNVSDLIEQIQR